MKWPQITQITQIKKGKEHIIIGMSRNVMPVEGQYRKMFLKE